MITLNKQVRKYYYQQARDMIFMHRKKFVCTALRQILADRLHVNIKVQDIPTYFPEIKNYDHLQDVPRVMLDHCIADLS